MEVEMDGACSAHGEMRCIGCYISRKTREEESTWEERVCVCIWGDMYHRKMGLKEIRRECAEWTQLAKNSGWWRAVVDTVMCLGLPWRAMNFFQYLSYCQLLKKAPAASSCVLMSNTTCPRSEITYNLLLLLLDIMLTRLLGHIY
jgi:hypothetical protein